MSKEEKKAIEMLEYIKEHNTLMGFNIVETETNVNYRVKLAIVLLNLIQKQQVENEKLEDKRKELENAICQEFGSEDCPQDCKVCLKNGKANNEIEILKKIHKEEKEKCEEKCILNKENKILKVELEKKDEIINKMAETIVEDTYQLKKFWCNGCFSTCEYENVKDCVIKYFEKEAKKEE